MLGHHVLRGIFNVEGGCLGFLRFVAFIPVGGDAIAAVVYVIQFRLPVFIVRWSK